MKTGVYLLAVCGLGLYFSAGADVHRNPDPHDPGLLFFSNPIAIKQSDFDTGPFRIQEPGYYYLEEDISFNPFLDENSDPLKGMNGLDGGRETDKPQTKSWFAAISVEVDNVVIDLNTKTLECAPEYVENHEFKVFAMIELNNSPFPHFVFAYTGETEFKAANNVTIKNGTLGRNPHHCIHGNRNSNIRIYDVVCKDWEVAGISLNGLRSGQIKNVAISGVEHEVTFTGLLAVIDSAILMLEKLVEEGDMDAQEYLYDVQQFKDDVKNDGHPSGTHDSNCYGLFLNRTVDVGHIPTGHCDDGTTNCIDIDNVTVCNIHADVIETVGIANKQGNVLRGIPFGIMRWEDAFGPGNHFEPNALLRAQTYVVHKNTPDALPDGFAENILSETPSKDLFISHAQPIFEIDFAGHTNKGVFGIRVDCGHGVSIKNCSVVGVSNSGVPGHTLDELPGGDYYYSLKQNRYRGNDVHGMSLAVCRNCHVADTKIFECSSDHGYVYGVNVNNEAMGNHLLRCYSNDHYAGGDNPGSIVNPSSHVYGFFVNKTAHSNFFEECTASTLSSPRHCTGFWVGGSKDNCFTRCTASCNKVTSSHYCYEPKTAYGFKSFAGKCNKFDECVASSIQCDNEARYSRLSDVTVAGFVLEGEYNKEYNEKKTDMFGSITNSISRCHNAGPGKAYGILLKGAENAEIVGNRLDNNHSNSKCGHGYGLVDAAKNSCSVILKNSAFGNSTQNYLVSYADIGKSLPLTTAAYGDISNLHYVNSWNNLSFDKDLAESCFYEKYNECPKDHQKESHKPHDCPKEFHKPKPKDCYSEYTREGDQH